jgi:hypothetical protein
MAAEDKLRAPERIRLEALAQAVIVSAAFGGVQAWDIIVRRAAAFEDYIVTGNVPR